MNRSDIRTEARRLLGDTSSIVFTDANLNSWADLWLVEILTRLELDQASQTIALVGSDTYASAEPNYSLGANNLFLFLTEVYFVDDDGNENRLYVVTQDELNTLVGQDWRSPVSSNVGEPQYAYLVDHNVLGIYPRPNAAHNGLTLRALGVRDPSNFSGDSDIPIVFKALHASAPWYMASLGYASKGDMDRSEYAKKRFEEIFQLHRHRQTKFSQDMMQWRWG